MSLRPVALICLSFALLLPTLSAASSSDAPAVREKILYSFKALGLNGFLPGGGLVADAQGNLYGTSNGGAFNNGLVFKLHPNSNGTYTKSILHTFQGAPDAAGPSSPLVFDSAGNLYGAASSGAVFELSPQANGSWKEQVISTAPASAANGLIIDKAGNLYGTTFALGSSTYIFELSPAAGGKWAYSVVHTFDGVNGDGIGPNLPVLDATGNLYGTTQYGGTEQCPGQTCGMAFELSPSSGGTWTETILYEFTPNANDGYLPVGSLTFDSQGNLYGATGYSGNNCSCGTIFELTPKGNGQWSENVLHIFQGGSEPAFPWGSTVFDSAGNLYSTSGGGGGLGNCRGLCGTVFELFPSGTGWQVSVLYSFADAETGTSPSSPVLFGPSGQILGETYQGGPNNNGLVFQLTRSTGGTWTEAQAATFRDSTDGDIPGTLVERNGSFYGTTQGGGLHSLGTAFEISPVGGTWKETVLYNFDIHQGFGLSGISQLVFDPAGNLYGETYSGGAGNGLIFELSPGSKGWIEKTRYEFSGSDGRYPEGGLAFDSAGNLYGTTVQGGAAGKGVVFKLTPGTGGTWTETVLHSFVGYPTDGGSPYGGVTLDQNGNLYGTTSEAGSGGCLKDPTCGVIYELALGSNGQWSETILHNFLGGNNDGGGPTLPPSIDPSGNLFGITQNGGPANACDLQGCGTAYELSRSGGGWNFTLLHRFSFANDGISPDSLVLDSAGNLYGTTVQGGAAGKGVVFKLTPGTGGKWTETILHSFAAFNGDGSYPAGVILGSDGNLYGAADGGTGLSGVAFEIVP